ncbi:hypothetical protein BU17DRAFT_65423 [Hysterangium stoloniferum]|nr:hypothetical protein BU17DRAFT_65423 [Hysterangium stoloniferum]
MTIQLNGKSPMSTFDEEFSRGDRKSVSDRVHQSSCPKPIVTIAALEGEAEVVEVVGPMEAMVDGAGQSGQMWGQSRQMWGWSRQMWGWSRQMWQQMWWWTW